jgi:TrmH family RNA methyltransferase
VSLISTIRDLHRRRGRERRALSLAEGVRLLEEALDAGITPRGAAVAPALEGTPRGVALKQRLTALQVPLEAVDDLELAKLADTEHPQGIVAVIEPPVWELGQLPIDRGSVFMVLDGVQDPGNVGAVARTALGLGASGMIALSGTADVASPKALRGSMGALYRLPHTQATPEGFLEWATAANIELWNTTMDGAPVSTVRRSGPIALLLGNEGAGVRPELAARARQSVSVPLRHGVESLNVAVAAGILLYEVTRE